MSHILRTHEIIKTDFVRGENCTLYDQQGRQYVDFESGIWSAALGHNHPRINQVIESQIEQIMHLGTRYPNKIAEKVAMDVLELLGIESGKCTFLSSGSEAVEFATQAARRITNKPILLTFTKSYLSAYGSSGRKPPEEWFLLDWTTHQEEDFCEVLEIIPYDQVGAFVFELGGSGSGFVQFPPRDIVQEIVYQVQQAGGLLVVNEVTTGMGRTGKWFGYQHYHLQPDIVAMGKGLGNGYPVSAVGMTHDCADTLEKSGLLYAQSHQNDPLGCAVASEVIAVMQEGNWVDRGNTIGLRFLNGLRTLQEQHAIVKESRGRGMLLALEFHPHEIITVSWAYHQLLEMGFLVGYYPAGNILRFDPSLTIEKCDIDRLLDCLDSMLRKTA
jgi:acetylornithine aminotransferase